jgi:hypothetical protein
MISKNQRIQGEYRFFIEYGWSGPNTDNEDELMEEGVFTKSVHRGYIKSVSSQYTFKGTEYNLVIMPNDFNNYNTGFNDTSQLYFQDEDRMNPVIGLLTLYLLLKTPGMTYEVLRDTTYLEGEDPKLNFLDTIFGFIETLEINKTVIPKQGTFYHFTYNGGKDLKTRTEIKPRINRKTGKTTPGGYKEDKKIVHLRSDENKSLSQIAAKLFEASKKVKEKTKNGNLIDSDRGLLKYVSLTGDTFETFKSVCDGENVFLNAWLVGLYVIWKFNQSNNIILCDTTGLFEIFKQTKKDITSMPNAKIIDIINDQLFICLIFSYRTYFNISYWRKIWSYSRIFYIVFFKKITISCSSSI